MSEEDIKEISTGCVLIKEGAKRSDRKILLMERFDRGKYEIPKGHIESYDKSLRSAAERELREETGLTNKIKVEEILAISGYEVRKKASKRNSEKRVKGKDGRCWKCVVYYRATLDSDSPVEFDSKACEDGTTDLRWFGIESLKKVRLKVPNTLPWMMKALRYDESVKAIDLIKTFRKQGKDDTTLKQIFKRAAMHDGDTSDDVFSISMFDRKLIVDVLSRACGLDILCHAGFKHVGNFFVLTDYDRFREVNKLINN